MSMGPTVVCLHWDEERDEMYALGKDQEDIPAHRHYITWTGLKASIERTEACSDISYEVRHDALGIKGIGLLERLEAKICRLENERDEAREWVDRMMKERTTTCIYCGHEYPPGTPASGTDQQALTDHIRQCTKHPLHQAQLLIYRLVGCLSWNKRERKAAEALIRRFIEGNYPDGMMTIEDGDHLYALHADGSTTVGNLRGLKRVRIKEDDDA